MATPIYHLYLDDSGTRFPNRKSNDRHDGLDYFALGGWLMASERVTDAWTAHARFTDCFTISAPLHSHSIRVNKGAFRWLEHEPKRASAFYADLKHTLCELPGHVVGCVIHRPGYDARYAPIYGDHRWDLCKSAYTIVVERAAKLAARSGRRLKVYLEHTGKHENQAIKKYHADLINAGMYFDPENSGKYMPFDAKTFASTLFKSPEFVQKSNPMAQFADLVLYPIAKARYEPDYPPYRSLWNAGRIVDATLSATDVQQLGIKYFCFDGL
jgi:hypothetical protein